MGNGEMENQQENYDLKVMASIFMNTDGEALQSRREELSLSQLEVAEMANIPLYKYQQFESGERKLQNASINTSIAICDVLELKEQRFFLTIIGLIHPKYDDDYEPSKPASPFAEWGFVNIESESDFAKPKESSGFISTTSCRQGRNHASPVPALGVWGAKSLCNQHAYWSRGLCST